MDEWMDGQTHKQTNGYERKECVIVSFKEYTA